MTVKVSPDHLQNEITLKLGQDLPLMVKMMAEEIEIIFSCAYFA